MVFRRHSGGGASVRKDWREKLKWVVLTLVVGCYPGGIFWDSGDLSPLAFDGYINPILIEVGRFNPPIRFVPTGFDNVPTGLGWRTLTLEESITEAKSRSRRLGRITAVRIKGISGPTEQLFHNNHCDNPIACLLKGITQEKILQKVFFCIK